MTNYRTGQVSGFSAGGVSFGWNNGGLSGAAFSGLVFGLTGDNSNYKGGFTSGTVSANIPIPNVGVQVTASSSSGGLTGTPQQMIPNGQVNSITARCKRWSDIPSGWRHCGGYQLFVALSTRKILDTVESFGSTPTTSHPSMQSIRVLNGAI